MLWASACVPRLYYRRTACTNIPKSTFDTPASTHLRHMVTVALRLQPRQHPPALYAVQKLTQTLSHHAWKRGGPVVG